MKNRSYFWLVAAAAMLSGCAGLMMNVKELDGDPRGVVLHSGDSVSIDESALESSFKQVDPDVDAKRLAEELKRELAKELSDKGVTVATDGSQKLTVEITRYDRGCGGCRGFFPFFGLGNTYLDGQVTLATDAGSRVLIVQKTGQSSGLSQMGDQTETNMGYFASVVASKLSDAPDDNKAD